MGKSPRVLTATVVTGVIGTTAVWFAPAASAATGPIVVNDPDEVPATAVEDGVSTYATDSTCATTRSWVQTTPGEHHYPTTHVETRWAQEIAAVPAQYRYLQTVPGQQHDAVTGYKYQRVVPGHAATESHTYKKNVTFYTVEHKKVRPSNNRNWSQDELAWLNSHATKIAGTTNEWQLNDKTVNDANVNPFDYPQGVWSSLGSLRPYGYNGQATGVDYYITAVEAYITLPSDAQFYQTHSGTVYYTGGDPNTGFSPKASDAAWVKGEAPAGWIKDKTKSNEDAVPDQKFYFDGSANGTTDPNGAVAQSSAPAGTWVKFGDQVVITKAYTDPDVTEYYTGVGKYPSTTEGDAVYTSSNPGGDWVSFGEKADGTGTEAYTVYHNPADPYDLTSTTLGDDNWTTFAADAGPQGWTFVDDREVIDVEGFDDPVEVTSYVWSDGVLCTTPDPSGPTPATPVGEQAELPHTGAGANGLVPGAAAAVLGGGLLLLASRRRQQA